MTQTAAGIDPAAPGSPTAIFEGNAADAVRLFQRNANVAASIGLAGIGLARAEVRLAADPGGTTNRHAIEATGGFGSLSIKLENAPLPCNPKTSALDGLGRLLAFVLTPGQAADRRAAEALPQRPPRDVLVMADRACDTDAVRDRTAAPDIPSKRNRRWKRRFSPVRYRGRKAIARMFGRFEDSRRAATHCDKPAVDFLAAVHLAATASHRAQVWSTGTEAHVPSGRG